MKYIPEVHPASNHGQVENGQTVTESLQSLY